MFRPPAQVLEMTDAERRGTMRYAVADTPVGPALIAATQRGVCWLSFDTSRAALEELQRQWPAATYLEDTALTLASAAKAVVLDGTAFQLDVWRALVSMPAGQTRTYGELADELGRPGASRAVGAACGANRVSLLVPCHRVLSSTGKLTGFRWGTDVKRKLLDAEQPGQSSLFERP